MKESNTTMEFSGLKLELNEGTGGYEYRDYKNFILEIHSLPLPQKPILKMLLLYKFMVTKQMNNYKNNDMYNGNIKMRAFVF